MYPFLIFTSNTEHLAPLISKQKPQLTVILPHKKGNEHRYFPDGEIYMKISGAQRLKKKRVVIIHAGTPRPNHGIVELELILQVLKDSSIKPEVFFSYFPYSMQDRVFEKGETNVAENLIEKLLQYYHVPKIYIIDPHFGGREWVRKYPIKTASAIPLLLAQAQKDFGKDIVLLSADKGGKRRTGIGGMNKKRLNSYRVKMSYSGRSLKEKIVGVIDDLIKTGGTLMKFNEIAKNAGAKKVIALVTHGVIPEGVNTIGQHYSKLYLANTISQGAANVDISGLIIETLA